MSTLCQQIRGEIMTIRATNNSLRKMQKEEAKKAQREIAKIVKKAKSKNSGRQIILKNLRKAEVQKHAQLEKALEKANVLTHQFQKMMQQIQSYHALFQWDFDFWGK